MFRDDVRLALTLTGVAHAPSYVSTPVYTSFSPRFRASCLGDELPKHTDISVAIDIVPYVNASRILD